MSVFNKRIRGGFPDMTMKDHMISLTPQIAIFPFSDHGAWQAVRASD
jgi:hypothetical protein